MQKINTENIYKYLQLRKKSSEFKKSLCLPKNQADLKNPCAFKKIRRIYRILALFQKSGGFEKSWRYTENQADDRILAGVKIPAPGEKLVGLEKLLARLLFSRGGISSC
jgi:hypothetical protein